MELLVLLVENRRELVSRADIEARVWGGDAPGDVERSINTAVRKIRQTLGDRAGRPRFVETVVGKGYRFVADVDEPEAVASAPENIDRSRMLQRWGVASLGLVAAAVALLWVRSPYQAASVATMRVRPLTALAGSASAPAFSPDGSQIVFSSRYRGPNENLFSLR